MRVPAPVRRFLATNAPIIPGSLCGRTRCRTPRAWTNLVRSVQAGFRWIRGAACAQFGASLPGRGPIFNIPIRSAEADRFDVDPSTLRQLTPTTALPMLFENFRRR